MIMGLMVMMMNDDGDHDDDGIDDGDHDDDGIDEYIS